MGQASGGTMRGYLPASVWLGETVSFAEQVVCSCREPSDWVVAEERVDSYKMDSSQEDDHTGIVRQPLQGARICKSSSSLDPERMSVAKKRLKGAIEAVKAVNRIAKTVRFSDETVVCFEVGSEGSSAFNGLAIGDKVVWSDADDDVPKGSIGEVTGFSAGGIVQVRFPKGTWDFRAAELSHQDTWSTGVARTAIAKAERLMRDLQVLEAESTLAEALMKLDEAVALEKFDPDVSQMQCETQSLTSDQSESGVHGLLMSSESSQQQQLASGRGLNDSSSSTSRGGGVARLDRAGSARLDRSGSGSLISGTRSPGMRRASLLSQSEAAEARAAIARMRESAVYKDVVLRAGQYQALGRCLVPRGFKLCWEGSGAQLWVHLPAGASWLEYRLVCDLGDATLAQCVAPSCEVDKPSKGGKPGASPKLLGPVHPSLVVTQALVRLLFFRVEMVLEKFRWFNTEFGFFAESLRSAFPLEGLDLPKKGWGNRVVLNAQHLWIPRGGGEQGTVAVQLVRLDPGSRLVRLGMGSLVAKAAPSLVEELRSSVARPCDAKSQSQLQERVKADKLGLYAQLAKVEATAAGRRAVTMSSLPGEEVVSRKLPLQTRWP